MSSLPPFLMYNLLRYQYNPYDLIAKTLPGRELRGIVLKKLEAGWHQAIFCKATLRNGVIRPNGAGNLFSQWRTGSSHKSHVFHFLISGFCRLETNVT